MQTDTSTIESRRFIIQKVADVLREERATATEIEPAVERAGIARDEVNATFGSMHGLILEMVSELSSELIQPLEGRAAGQAVQDVLIEFGNRLVEAYSGSHLIALHRIVLVEATLNSAMRRAFYERGPGRLRFCLAKYLEYSAKLHSHLRINNSARVADNFIGLLGDNLEFSDARAARTSSAKDRRDAVIEAVELFCHGIVRTGSPGRSTSLSRRVRIS